MKIILCINVYNYLKKQIMDKNVNLQHLMFNIIMLYCKYQFEEMVNTLIIYHITYINIYVI